MHEVSGLLKRIIYVVEGDQDFSEAAESAKNNASNLF